MQRHRTLVGKLLRRLQPDHTPRAATQGRSIFSRLAVPYTFSPDLSLGDALIAIAGCLTRIFAACVLFAVWGVLSALAWSAIENHFWRAAAVLALVLIFLAGLATVMIAISRHLSR
ncbi:MAG TPA: hypothetical protein VNY05_43280 [Candidatus Acidoferrales bacterium]|jgi:hypothetical protein|nr:hypothetical protein [Candidatus Acidoferrales bacterium]